MEISREFYLKKLVRRKHNGLVKVVTGLKGCGKSYLLNRIFYRHLLNAGTDAKHIIRFAFDSAEDLKLIGESLPELEKEKRGVHPEKFMDFISAKTAGDGRYYLLLDEIQLLDCFELVLNGYLSRENLDVYVTAGRAERLSRNVATEFAGRGDKVRLYPLSFAEFMSVYDGDRYAGLSEYLRCGGLPQVVLCADAREKEALLQDFLYKACRSVLARLGRRQSGGSGGAAAHPLFLSRRPGKP